MYRAKDEYELAREDIVRALELEPRDLQIRKEYTYLQNVILDYKEKTIMNAKKMVSGSTGTRGGGSEGEGRGRNSNSTNGPDGGAGLSSATNSNSNSNSNGGGSSRKGNVAADDYIAKLGVDNSKELYLEDDIILSREIPSLANKENGSGNGRSLSSIKQAPQPPPGRLEGRGKRGKQTIMDFVYYFLS
jgi:hypothetical protein